ncbi:TPA: hypothetical protein N0F65_000233 [Lagenidium giganteum]|uniref:Uncharacterized protein n=1 Tax=Lagenidium giganteum TaxID=4803 RepID=A0AAV2YHA9_9STRA|nr:TPA: hypothetical protein N0F65_000233 [Lagenidium giganteum]
MILSLSVSGQVTITRHCHLLPLTVNRPLRHGDGAAAPARPEAPSSAMKKKRSPFEVDADVLVVSRAKRPAIKGSVCPQAEALPPLGSPGGSRGGGNNARGTPDKQAAHSPMSIDVLEQKKMLLPYLDKIEYINYQLRQRGLLPEEEQPSAVRAPAPSRDHVAAIQARNDPTAPVARKGGAKRSPAKMTSPQHGALGETCNQEAPLTTAAPATHKKPKLTNEVFRTKYPRFAAPIANLSGMTPRERPITWLLRLIEDMFDVLTTAYLADDYAAAALRPESPTVASPPGTPTPPIALRAGRLAMPNFARRYLDHTLGLPELADQDSLDVMYNAELVIDQYAQVAVFSSFLREIYDDDALLFFLLLRRSTVNEFDLDLRAKEKVAISSATSHLKKYIVDDLYSVAPHPLIPDGTKQAQITRRGCVCVLKSFFTLSMSVSAGTPPMRSVSSLVLAEYVVHQKIVRAQPEGSERDVITVEDFLARCIDLFREIEEDIIAQYKYNDDGESLNNLTRLRETIINDEKIGAWTTHYEQEERKLRNMKIDLLKMERSNENNQHRIQIRLLQNRISLQEQELEHIQGKIASTVQLVDGVWKEVLRPKGSIGAGKKRKAASSANGRNASASSTAPTVSSVLGRFECYMSRLQHKHAIEVKAAAVLSKSWKQQLEELKLRMIIKIQRAYRARRQAREIKNKAREEFQEKIRQHEQRRKNEDMERKRIQSLQERDAQRHQARLEAKRQQDADQRNQLDKRQQELLSKMREAEAEQRAVQHNRQLMSHLVGKWKQFVTQRKNSRRATRLFLKFQFMIWKRHFAVYLHRKHAAITIQRAARHHKDRINMKKILKMRAKRTTLASKYLRKVQMRMVAKLFSHWHEFADERIYLRNKFDAIFHKRTARWFGKWVICTQQLKEEKLEAVLSIQRAYRGRLARGVLQFKRHRHRCAVTIQRIYRGHRSRQSTAILRRVRTYQSDRGRAILQRVRYRQAVRCFQMLAGNAQRERTIKTMHKARLRLCQKNHLKSWYQYVQHQLAERAEYQRLLFKSAVLIQRNFRRLHCQKMFRIALARHRAAITIQRVYRGHRDRQWTRWHRMEIQAAIQLQTAWRKRKAKLLADAVRAENILLSAYKGDYTATKRALEQGYWHVQDKEGNTIFHLVAAAAHRRLIKLCLRFRLDVNAVNRRQQTPMHLLLANLPPCMSFEDEQDKRLRAEKVELATYMIDHGAWHEAPDEEGLTPLLLCSALGQTEAVDMLLDRAANTDARTWTGKLNAAQLAVEANHADTLAVLLASRGFDYGDNGKDTLYLLHATASRGLIDCLRVLISHYEQRGNFVTNESPINARDEDGYTPLIYGICNGFADITSFLLEHGADPDAVDFFGRSPLHFALSFGTNGHVEIVNQLTMYEANVNAKDYDGDAPLHASCDRDERLACTAALLHHGAAIASNALGNHPSHIAACHGAVQTLKLLVEYGADMNLKNYEGKTPLGMARMYGQQSVVAYVKEHFAQEAQVVAELKLHEEEQAAAKAATEQLLGITEDLEEPDKSEDQASRFPEMTALDWEEALAHGFRLGKLAEWTLYVDVKSEFPFYVTTTNGDPVCSWEMPVEFDAALGEDWDIVRYETGRGGSSRAVSIARSASASSNISHTSSTHSTNSSVKGSFRRALRYSYRFHNRVTDEYRTTLPPINLDMLQDVVQRSKRHKQLRARVHKVSTESSASAMEYMRFFQNFEEESAQTRAELQAARKIQRHYRARRTRILLRALLFENKCAIHMQRAFRGRKARRQASHERLRHASATKIRAVWTGYQVRLKEKQGLHAARVLHRHRWFAARKIQRLFRGHTARRALYRIKVVRKLGPRSYFDWQEARKHAVAVRKYKVWDELELREQFPGVYFYCHHVTGSCSWDKPKEWIAADRVAFEERRQMFAWGFTVAMKSAAIRLQQHWRARVARISFRVIMKAVHLMKACKREYLEDPTNLVKMGNYVLYLHTIVHDYERARPIYARLMRMMAQRGPDVPFILLSYGLFLYVTCAEDVSVVEEMIYRGKQQDKQLIKYKMAYLGFFRQSMVQNPFDCESNLNYAVCLQWLLEQYSEATKYYLRAIAANPHRHGTMDLFQEMLNRKKSNDKLHINQKPKVKPKSDKERMQQKLAENEAYDAYELFRRWQVAQAAEDDARRRDEQQAQRDSADRLAAAKKIQARYRRRRAIRVMNRLKLEKNLATSIAELAQQKQIYDRVVSAFEHLFLAEKEHKHSKHVGWMGGKKQPQLSVPTTQLEALFNELRVSLTPEELHATTQEFREQHPKLQHVNVMDVCNFAERSSFLHSKLVAKK